MTKKPPPTQPASWSYAASFHLGGFSWAQPQADKEGGLKTPDRFTLVLSHDCLPPDELLAFVAKSGAAAIACKVTVAEKGDLEEALEWKGNVLVGKVGYTPPERQQDHAVVKLPLHIDGLDRERLLALVQLRVTMGRFLLFEAEVELGLIQPSLGDAQPAT